MQTKIKCCQNCNKELLTLPNNLNQNIQTFRCVETGEIIDNLEKYRDCKIFESKKES